MPSPLARLVTLALLVAPLEALVVGVTGTPRGASIARVQTAIQLSLGKFEPIEPV